MLHIRSTRALALIALTQLIVACGGAAGTSKGRSIAALPLVPYASALLFPATGKLMALYSFNKTLNDSSGNGKNAKDSGTPTYVTGAPFGGDAIKFDGSGKAIVTAPLDISVADLKQVTFGGWFKALSIATPEYGIVSNDDGDFDRSLDIDNRDAGGGINWSAFVGGTVVGKVAVKTGQWVFAAVAFNQATLPGKFSFYVHNAAGLQIIRGADNFDTSSVKTGVDIGRNPSFDQPFDGLAANVFFYDGILTQTQIQNIIAKGPSAIP
ncbi:MAG TPA: LamG-like jellyroll fold domain-containing protein [Candidatus Baltobacteraceae bacterium]|nr:LamG-like jellyroll fold domain-containing protein [Candidatus Baltobacteraceae bacterium]